MIPAGFTVHHQLDMPHWDAGWLIAGLLALILLALLRQARK